MASTPPSPRDRQISRERPDSVNNRLSSSSFDDTLSPPKESPTKKSPPKESPPKKSPPKESPPPPLLQPREEQWRIDLPSLRSLLHRRRTPSPPQGPRHTNDPPPVNFLSLFRTELGVWDNWVLFLPDAFFFFLQWVAADHSRLQDTVVTVVSVFGFALGLVFLMVHSLVGLPYIRNIFTICGCFEAVSIAANGIVACFLVWYKIRVIYSVMIRAGVACLVRIARRAAIKRWPTMFLDEDFDQDE